MPSTVSTSFESSESQSSQSAPIPLHDFLSTHDDQHFVWDDADRETSGEWLTAVDSAGLNPKKHKVFNHGGKAYLTPPDPFVQIKELGDSGSTIVYKVTAPETSAYRRPLALKVIVCKESSRPPGPDSKARSDALKEVKTMSELRHPHIVAYVASFEDCCIQPREIRQRPRPRQRAHNMVAFRVNQRIKKHILGIAMYPPAQCNLRVFMEEVCQAPQDVWERQHLYTYFGCLSQAVAYLHRQSIQIRHKDIKPDNIVIDEFGLPVLTDFGLSRHFETGKASEGPTPKTLKYAGPEAIYEAPRDHHSDIFSLGCVFLEMATVLLGHPTDFAEEQLSISTLDTVDARSISSSGTGRNSEFKYCDVLRNLDAYLDALSLLARGPATATSASSSLTLTPAQTAASPNSTPRPPPVTTLPPDPALGASVKGVLAVLPHIRRMMDPVQTRRPDADQLYPLFRHLYDIYDKPGPCFNCEEEHRTGNALPSRSGNGSPTLSRGVDGVGFNGSQGLARRSTAASTMSTAMGMVAGRNSLS